MERPVVVVTVTVVVAPEMEVVVIVIVVFAIVIVIVVVAVIANRPIIVILVFAIVIVVVVIVVVVIVLVFFATVITVVGIVVVLVIVVTVVVIVIVVVRIIIIIIRIIIVVVVHVKNVIERCLELSKSAQMVFTVSPSFSYFIDPLHLRIRQLLPVEPLVDRAGLYSVQLARQAHGILMVLVEEVYELPLPVPGAVGAVRQLIECCDDKTQLDHVVIFALIA